MSECKVYYFNAQKNTNRFNKNQKVWISHLFAHHMYIWFKWRGNGRYVNGIIDRYSKAVGEIKQVDVNETFAKRVWGRSNE